MQRRDLNESRKVGFSWIDSERALIARDCDARASASSVIHGPIIPHDAVDNSRLFSESFRTM